MTINAYLLQETDKARQFDYRGLPVWIPRSVIPRMLKHSPDSQGRRLCEVDVAEWWATKNNLDKHGTLELNFNHTGTEAQK